MTRISVDSSCDPIDTTHMDCVGDALNTVIGLLPTTKFIKEIEIDGRKIKHFLTDTETKKAIHTVSELKVHTADRAQWCANGIDIALSALERIHRTLLVTAELFRDKEHLEANKLFARCMDGLERFWDAVTMTRVALNLNFSELSSYGTHKVSDHEAQFLEIVRGFVRLQNEQIYEALADKIEFELIPHLSRWTEILTRIQSDQNIDA